MNYPKTIFAFSDGRRIEIHTYPEGRGWKAYLYDAEDQVLAQAERESFAAALEKVSGESATLKDRMRTFCRRIGLYD